MNRECPNCHDRVIPVRSLLVANAWCGACRNLVGVHWLLGAVANTIILVATLAAFFVVNATQGLYAALLLLPLPVGALGYIKARYLPLEAKGEEEDQ